MDGIFFGMFLGYALISSWKLGNIDHRTKEIDKKLNWTLKLLHKEFEIDPLAE
jgi:hypothetical protein